MTVKILLADDHKMFREGLRSLLEKDSDFSVIAEADNGSDTIRLAENLSPDVIIMDISMLGLNGIEATKEISINSPQIKIVILSMHSDKRFVIEALKAGASGYILKDSAFEELTECIKQVINNKTFLSGKINEIVIQDYLKLKKEKNSPSYLLSPRELEVLHFIVDGKTTKQIASQLFVSTKTIETHRKQIMDKLDIHTLPELTRFAIREGIISP
jgi:DNA-binding NarL/FixJ family response regulator